MSVPKNKALLICCAALLLGGCGQPLSEREIVRAVFFARQQGQYSVCLLLADQNASEDDLHYKTSSARGVTAAQALHRAEDALPGQIYYGLLDLAALPQGCDLDTAQELGTLLYDKAQPAPELSVFVLDDAENHSWAKDGAVLYEDMKAIESVYDLHCGLQQLFAQSGCCAIPGYRRDSGYDLYLLAKDSASQPAAGLSAQLAAVLCGQTDNFFSAYAEGQALCRAKVNVTVDGTAVQLHLRDTDFQSLTGQAQDLYAAFCTELQQDFGVLTSNQSADLFRLRFWYADLYGPSGIPPAPTLEIFLE